MDTEPSIAAPPAEPNAARLSAVGVLISLALHVAGYGVVRAVRGEAARPAPVMTTIDLDLAPIAPAAEVLPPEEELAAAAARAAAEDQVPLAPPPPDPDGVGVLDAGIDAAPPIDARLVDARPPRDAGLDGGGADAPDARDASDALDAGVDAPLVAVLDGGAGDGGAVASGEVADGGAVAAGEGDGGLDGGGVATTGEPDRAGTATRVSSGTAANLLTYAPAGHVVTLLVRADRLRGTEWATHVEAMLAPLPDHDALIGDQAVNITDVFDTLVISSDEPSRADATTLVARSSLAPAALRDLLDQPDARVLWTPTVGGALGRRQPSRRLLDGDTRVFLTWAPGWTTLAHPDDLAGLLQPATIGLDHAFAAPDRLPAWLDRVSTIEAESGVPDGPALMLTAADLFPARLELPRVDADIPGPQRATLTLTIDPKGFVVRGSLRYPDEPTAALAAEAIVQAQGELTGSAMMRLALGTMKAWNAVKNLTVQRTGTRVAFSTSISTGDARVLLARIGELLAARFGAMRTRRPARSGP